MGRVSPTVLLSSRALIQAAATNPVLRRRSNAEIELMVAVPINVFGGANVETEGPPFVRNGDGGSGASADGDCVCGR